MINKLYDNCFTTELSTKVLEVREDTASSGMPARIPSFIKKAAEWPVISV